VENNSVITNIDRLYSGSKNFLLIGLTGYTKSGCNEFSECLQRDQSPSLDLDQSEYTGLDQKKFDIARVFMSKNWQKFEVIKVSHVITAFMLSMSQRNIIDIVEDTVTLWADPDDSKIESYIKDLNKIAKSTKKTLLKIRKNNDINDVFETITDYLLFDFRKEGDSCSLVEKRCLIDLFDDKYKANKIGDIFIKIKDINKNLKSEMNEVGGGLYNIFLQILGSVIRKGLELKVGKEMSKTNIHTVPKIINRLIKIYRIQNDFFSESDQPKPCRIVIENIRNSHEIDFFRERYSAFYVVSINRNEESRALELKKYKAGPAIDSLECGEFPKLDGGGNPNLAIYSGVNDKREAKEFWLPNIANCLQKTDIHLFDDNASENKNNLKAQATWYLALMLHPGLFPPTIMERSMKIAHQAKFNSGCISRQVGAVVSDGEDRVLSIGWNEVPKGQTPCILRSSSGCIKCNDSNKDYSEYEKKNRDFRKEVNKSIESDQVINAGLNNSYCFKDTYNKVKSDTGPAHIRALHAEENAMLQVGKFGNVKGGKLYTTTCTCALCAKKASELEISEIIYIDPYKDISMGHELKYINSPKLIQFRGAIGPNFEKLYTPKLPFKIELEILKKEV